MTPQQKTLVTLATAGAVAVGLGLYAFYGVMQPEETQREEKARSEQLFAPRATDERAADGGTLGPPEFTRLSVTHAGVTTTLERSGETWQVVAPLKTGADPGTVDGILRTLQTAKTLSVVEERPTDADLQKYGLAPPKFVVVAHARVPQAQGRITERDFTLQGGIENSFDGSVYVRRDADPRVYQAEGALRLTVDRSTVELRNKEVLGFEVPQVTQLSVKLGKAGYALARDAAKAWQVTQPKPMAADTASVDQWLGSLRGERALSFPDDAPDQLDAARKRLGLDTPAQDITLTLASGAPIRLRFSRQTDAGVERAYLLREQGASVVLAEMATSALRHLDHTLEELRDKAVLTFSRDAVAQVTLAAPDSKPLVLTRTTPATHADGGTQSTEETWSIAGSDEKARGWKVFSLLWTLSSLRATAVAAEAPKDWAKYGLDAHARTVTLSDAAGSVLGRLIIGKDVPGQQGAVYVRGTRDAVLEVDASRLADLPKSPADLRDAPVADGGAAP